MTDATLTADYVIAGAGAEGLAFADTMLASHPTATMIVVDRRARPGGHWNDAYPFVRLHGPSVTYGVESMPLGSERIDAVGLNQGLHELASGPEICAYFDRVMRERLLPSGRVRWLPLHELGRDGVARSRLTGRALRLQPLRRWVDATIADTQVPATHAPPFDVQPGVRLATPTTLSAAVASANAYVVVGAGKTAMDTVLWLLEHGTDPDAITWVRPRDAWLLPRERMQPTMRFIEPLLAGLVAEFEAAGAAHTPRELFHRLERAGQLLRIDPAVEPTIYRCAIVSQAELDQLRRVRRVVRAGHVRAIEAQRVLLDRGSFTSSLGHLHVHCASGGLPRGAAQAVFQDGRIVPQYVRRCAPTFSAAFVAHVEATVADSDVVKNALCTPVPVPHEPLDWIRMQLATAQNQRAWARDAPLQRWLRQSRLEAYAGLLERAACDAQPLWQAAQLRLQMARPEALRNLQRMLQPVAELV